MTKNFPKLTTMTEVRKNSTETTTFSKLSARKMSNLKISAKANTPKRRFRFQKIGDAEIEVSAEAEVPLLRKLQNLSQCDRALSFSSGPGHTETHFGVSAKVGAATVEAEPPLRRKPRSPRRRFLRAEPSLWRIRFCGNANF